MLMCEHHQTVGDNYGISCRDCGGTLEGYGYGCWLDCDHLPEQCIHVWFATGVGREGGEEECLYCHVTRKRATKGNSRG